MTRILLTTTSFQDTPGAHHKLIEGFEIVRERGPLPESRMLELVAKGDFDGWLIGDDAITRTVIQKSLPRLKVISKYGIGLDKVDVKAATELKVPVTYCPGVNHTTVAEHTFGLMLAIFRDIVVECNHVKAGNWKRLTGHELMGKTIAVLGMGRIGKEVALRAHAFSMKVIGFDKYWDFDFARHFNVTRAETADAAIQDADVISLHTNLSDETRHLINAVRLAKMKKGAVLINTARSELVDMPAIIDALKSNHLAGYGTDVLDQEPPPKDHPLFACPNAIITPHIGSRTYESVARQATMAAENLIRVLQGQPALAQANKF
ncbi:MAG: Glyoxylate/hydroxypyruvate reductase B [Verrucomicrobiae bacterium]|nr:Glyoxylate/hydroxypyruvate reductase B [Verrucomicrobiae bacterium]